MELDYCAITLGLLIFLVAIIVTFIALSVVYVFIAIGNLQDDINKILNSKEINEIKDGIQDLKTAICEYNPNTSICQ